MASRSGFPVRESDPTAPVSAYGTLHLACEREIEEARRNDGLALADPALLDRLRRAPAARPRPGGDRHLPAPDRTGRADRPLRRRLDDPRLHLRRRRRRAVIATDGLEAEAPPVDQRRQRRGHLAARGAAPGRGPGRPAGERRRAPRARIRRPPDRPRHDAACTSSPSFELDSARDRDRPHPHGSRPTSGRPHERADPGPLPGPLGRLRRQ